MKFLSTLTLTFVFFGYCGSVFPMDAPLGAIGGDPFPAPGEAPSRCCSRTITALKILVPILVLAGLATGGYFLWQKVNQVLASIETFTNKFEAFMQGCPFALEQAAPAALVFIAECRAENGCVNSRLKKN
jgi:hypothetical protein